MEAWVFIFFEQFAKRELGSTMLAWQFFSLNLQSLVSLRNHRK